MKPDSTKTKGSGNGRVDDEGWVNAGEERWGHDDNKEVGEGLFFFSRFLILLSVLFVYTGCNHNTLQGELQLMHGMEIVRRATTRERAQTTRLVSFGLFVSLIGLSRVKSHEYDLGIATSKDEQFLTDRNINVHLPEGSIGKEGPSAGTAIVSAFVSLFTKTRVNSGIGAFRPFFLKKKNFILLPSGVFYIRIYYYIW